MEKEKIISEFSLFSFEDEGIGGWINVNTDEEVLKRIEQIKNSPLPKVQFNQLLVLGHEAPVSDDFFHYYWLSDPKSHPYDVKNIEGFSQDFIGKEKIISIDHLKWGLYRIYVDGLLWFGNIRNAFRTLRSKRKNELENYFSSRRFDTGSIIRRGPALPLMPINKDDRYLISEMACKSYGTDDATSKSALETALFEAFQDHKRLGGGPITIRKLLEGEYTNSNYQTRQMELIFSADDVLEESISNFEEIKEKYNRIADRFINARNAALHNTKNYLSMVNDLDVYVATSMRNRQDFRKMADTCENIFSNTKLKDLNIRYFDPTLSAAVGHEDKGLIECLMVKCAKALVYCAGEKESYGKDAEAAMALCLGKPVIFYCDQKTRSRFYREVHPLSRLIEFNTGVAVGAIVTDKLDEVSELLYRIFENKLEYKLEQYKKGYFRLKENITGSVIRIQTNDRMLSETFWNHYHNK